MTITTMVLLSQENSNQEERINSYILKLQLQKITYNGVEGFFIPLQGHKQLVLMINDYIYYQDLVKIKDERINVLEKMGIENFKLKTALGITISFDVGAVFVIAGLGMLLYNLDKMR